MTPDDIKQIRKRACIEDEVKFFVERYNKEKGTKFRPLLREGRRNAIAARKHRIEQIMKRQKKEVENDRRNELG